jgi:antitoxin component YwqK of YwqJK toxin-antitoxin module
MKSIVTLFTIFLAFATQSQILKKTYHDYQKTKVHYVYYVNGSGQYNGLLTQYTYDGAKLGEETYVNGIKNGVYKEYYTRGGVSKLKITGTYKNDAKQGQWTTYTLVKYGQSYFNIIESMMFNDKQVDIFNTGVQTKVNEETYNNGQLTKEIIYHINGKIAISRNFINRTITGDYLAYSSKNNLIIKGKIGDKGKMIGEWIIPRKEDGTSADKNNTEECAYTQKIKFDKNGNLDTNFKSKSYYLSGKLRDSVKIISFEFPSGYNYNGIWFLCGKNTGITGPYKKFYENGKIMQEGNYKTINGNSREVGIWKFYNQDGSFKEEKDYDALLQQEKLDKEKSDSINIDHTLKIENWFEVYSKANEAYIKFITLYMKKSNIKPFSGEFEQVRDYWPNQQSGYVQDVYITYNKPKLFPYFKEITEFYFESKDAPINTINKIFPMKLSDFTSMFNQNPQKYFSSIENLQKITTLIPKMIACAENNTKELEKQLTTGITIEEKIKIIENYQLDPK